MTPAATWGLILMLAGLGWCGWRLFCDWADHRLAADLDRAFRYGLDEHDAAWDEHVTSALGLVSATPIHDELAIERLRADLDSWGDAS